MTVRITVILAVGLVALVSSQVSADWTVTQLTNNSTADYAPQISGSNVVWYAFDGSDDEIFLYDGSTTTQLTNNSTGDYDPQISGSNVVWRSWDGSDYEIYIAVPEPTTLGMIALGGFGLLYRRRGRQEETA